MKKFIALVSLLGASLVAATTVVRAGAGTELTTGTYTTPVSLSTGTETIDSPATLDVGSGSQSGQGLVAITVTGNSAIVNHGTIEEPDTAAASAQNGRAIRVNTANVTLSVTNTGTITSGDADVIQLNKASDSITFNNSGLLDSMNYSGGGAQALDFNAVTSGSNTVFNSSTGTIEATAADAVRPGVNGVVNNDGTIIAMAANGNASSSDGIDAQTNTGVSITNAYTLSGGVGTGLIEGARHGITGGNTTTGTYTMSITNNNGGTIVGEDGSGINIDGINGSEMVTITNHGTITGNGVTADGDGVDVDGLVTLTNTGTITSTKALNDTSEGVTVGGGTIINSGTIEGDNINGGVGRGITLAGVDKDTNDNPIPIQTIYANSSVDNSGLIKGQTDSAIAVEGVSGPTNFTVTITNEATGTLTGAGSNAVIEAANTMNNDTVTNYGTIISAGTGKAIELGGGTNTVSILGGQASVTGDISGGAGSSSMTIDPGSGNAFNYNGVISNFTGGVQVKSGTVTFTGANTYTGTTTVSGGNLQVGNGTSANGAVGTGSVIVSNLASLTLNQASNSSLANNIAINSGGTLTNVGTATTTLSGNLSGAGAFKQNSAGTTELTGNNSSFTGTTTVSNGTLTIGSTTALAAGALQINSGGTLLFAASGVSQTAANVTLNGGILSLASAGANATENLGSLTLTANSTIVFGGTASDQTLTFSGLTFSGSDPSSIVLTIQDWSGNKYYATDTNDSGSSSQDRLVFTSDPGLTAQNTGTSQIQFYGDSGDFINNGKEVTYEGGPDEELVPAPEPSTYVAAFGLLLLAAWRERRRLMHGLAA